MMNKEHKHTHSCSEGCCHKVESQSTALHEHSNTACTVDEHKEDAAEEDPSGHRKPIDLHQHPEGASCGHHHADCTDCSGTHTHDGCGCGCEDSVGDGKKLINSLIASAVLFVAGFFFTDVPAIQTTLCVAATLISGFPIFKLGLANIAKFSFDETALLLVAVIGAFAIGEVTEATLVTMLFRLGNLVELKASEKARGNIRALTDILPKQAARLDENNHITMVEAAQVGIGERILIKAGDKVPLDCEVLEGSSAIDNAALTGESVPVPVGVGDTLLSGGVNTNGRLICRTTSLFEDSTATKIIRLVEESSAAKGRTEHLVSRFAKIYTPIVLALAILIAVLPPLLGFGSFTMWLYRALVLLVASCPCALVISIPMCFYAGVGASSKVGVLIKGTKFIEALALADTVVFDKTGTITTGQLSVDEVVVLDHSVDVLALAATAESFSSHPIANAIAQKGKHLIAPQRVSEYEEFAGKGISMLYDGKKVICGSNRLLEDFGIDDSTLPPAGVYLAVEQKVVGYITLSDKPREDASATIQKLKALGIRHTAMLTGDNAVLADAVGTAVGIDVVKASLLPAQKVEEVLALRTHSTKTVFVGDGINDGPVLATADVGIAMGLGSDLALQSADAILISDSLSSLPKAIQICRLTLSKAKFNLVFALLVKAVVLVLAFVGYGNMGLAVFADVGVTILTLLNSTTILKAYQKF